MRQFIGRIAAFVFATALWAAALVRGVLDWTGRATVIDDAHQIATERLPKWAEWLFSTPWWFTAILALGLTVIVVWLNLPSRPTSRREDRVTPQSQAVPPLKHEARATDAVSVPNRPSLAEIVGTVSDPPEFDPRGLYVGSIDVDAQHLASDLYLTLAIRCFNGSGRRVSVRRATGAISVSTAPKAGGSVTAIGSLPAPRLMDEQSQARGISPHAELFLVLEQRVPKPMAEIMQSTLNQGDMTQLGLNGLDLIVSPDNDEPTQIKLSTWSGVALSRSPDRIFVGRIIEAVAHSSGSATAAS